MGILDKIGIGKGKDDQAQDNKPKEQKVKQDKSEKAPAEQSAKKPAEKKLVDGSVRPNQNLVRPVISEKATALAIDGRYVFRVYKNANKSEVKKSIEDLYNVDVESVNMISVPGKVRRYGRSIGKTSSWKKAIIKVKSGQKIPGIIETV